MKCIKWDIETGRPRSYVKDQLIICGMTAECINCDMKPE